MRPVKSSTSDKKILSNEKGQAFFEMIMFVPFMLFLFTLIVTFGSAINGAINQNKILRGYFWHITRHNSYGTPQSTLKVLADKGVTEVGLHVIGYREQREGSDKSHAACYRINRFFGGTKDETCEEPSAGEDSTAYIRVYTLYGVCAASYGAVNDGFEVREFFPNTADQCTNGP